LINKPASIDPCVISLAYKGTIYVHCTSDLACWIAALFAFKTVWYTFF
jgi:hypothetical protein